MLLFVSGRGGSIVTVGASFYFFWMALSGQRPKHRYTGETQQYVDISTTERIAWAALGIGLIAYEVWKFHAWAQTLKT